MRIGVWKTGHPIADSIANVVIEGLSKSRINSTLSKTGNYSRYLLHDYVRNFSCHIGYGILRGTADVFNACDAEGLPWFNLDRGYINPGHYGGYYRVSLGGTQHTAAEYFIADSKRLDRLDVKFKPWRGFDYDKPVLICPPTDHVKGFFSTIESDRWIIRAISYLQQREISKYVIRQKGIDSEINYNDYNFVLTFNSSIGWIALKEGIPCISDPDHSLVGSLSRKIPLDQLSELQESTRHNIYALMSSNQLTLDEIREGQLWPLMSKLMSGSGTIPGKQLPPMCAPIA